MSEPNPNRRQPLPPNSGFEPHRSLQPDAQFPYLIQSTPNMNAYVYPGATLDNLELGYFQVHRILRRAVLKPRRCQLLILQDREGPVIYIRLKNAPGGRVLLHPDDAGTPLAAALGSALERIGCLNKLGVAPAPFDAGVPADLRGWPV